MCCQICCAPKLYWSPMEASPLSTTHGLNTRRCAAKAGHGKIVAASFSEEWWSWQHFKQQILLLKHTMFGASIAGPEPCSGPKCDGGIPGIQASNVCCPATCGTCGGSGCSTRDGGDGFTGREACCGSGVRSLGRMCSATVGAPCVTPSSGESKKRSACRFSP